MRVEEVVAREPDLIIGSWCARSSGTSGLLRGMASTAFQLEQQDLYEIKSSLILQPGPVALTDGLSELQRIIERWAIRCRTGPP